MKSSRFLTFFLICLFLAGCANLPAFLSTPEPAAVSTNTPAPITTATPTATPTDVPGGSRILRIWVPPRFDPAAETAAGALFQERLTAFGASRPGLQIEVRVKAESGASGLLNALSTTRSAAPSIMPDLVALSRADMDSATAKGLLHPMDGLSTLHEDPDWYPFARQMAHIQNSGYGLPFAGDALSLVGYRYPLPTAWSELPEETLFIFPAADQRGLFTLSLYLSAGGTLQDSQGRLTLDEPILVNTLSFFAPDPENDFISSQVVTYETYEQSWNAFREQRGNLVVNWTSSFLEESTPLALGALPGLETGQYSLATGWSWALAGSNPENQSLAVELAEFLSDSEYLAEWSQAAGYIPTRPTALSSWGDAREQTILSQTAESASLIPGEDLLVTVGPLFSEATLAVLNGDLLPADAAKSIIDQLQ